MMTQGMYQIKIKGQINKSRVEWFEDWNITQENDGTTLLTSPMIDQPALHGVLVKIRNLNLLIISVNCLEPIQTDFSIEKTTRTKGGK